MDFAKPFSSAVLSMLGTCSVLISSMLAFLNKIKTHHFFSASTTTHELENPRKREPECIYTIEY
jgi:hypothetical protein